jgi:enoyl-CoA hydratase/carnithine racemase
MSEPVHLDIADNVATLTLNRPDNRNALSLDLTRALVERLDEVQAADNLRCVVLTGTDGTFSAGGDISHMEEEGGETILHEKSETIRLETHRALRRFAEFHLPTVTAVNGVAGANLALAGDITLASSEAQLSFGFRQVGLTIDTGTSYFLPREVGISRAKELVYTGEVLDAEQAADLGLYNHVFDAEEFEAEVEAFIEPIATGPTAALKAAKQLLDQGFASSLKDTLNNEALAQGLQLGSLDHEEGIAAFAEKRDPEFHGR